MKALWLSICLNNDILKSRMYMSKYMYKIIKMLNKNDYFNITIKYYAQYFNQYRKAQYTHYYWPLNINYL